MRSSALAACRMRGRTKPAKTLLLKAVDEICRGARRNLPEEQKAGGTAATRIVDNGWPHAGTRAKREHAREEREEGKKRKSSKGDAS